MQTAALNVDIPQRSEQIRVKFSVYDIIYVLPGGLNQAVNQTGGKYCSGPD